MWNAAVWNIQTELNSYKSLTFVLVANQCKSWKDRFEFDTVRIAKNLFEL